MRRLSVFELLASALCLWAAWYHTPAGALIRGAGARIFGVRSSARPLLAYYGAGVYGGRISAGPALAGPVPPAQALGYGAWAALAALDAAERSQLGIPASQPAQLASQLRALAARLGSEESAVLALFCGEEPARYARDRAGSDSLEDLARQLPPRYADRIALASQALMLGSAYALGWPLPESAHITSPFGLRDHPVLGARKLHAGVDLGVPVGTLVRASGEGIVRRASSDSQNGRILVLDHGRGVVTVYCHNDELLVRDGQRVARGQPISRSGNTGRSTGPHLHYQLDLAGQPVDPLHYRATRPKVSALDAED
jgi:murein DD-endopeptidase MepM/ murein hydrolase activator NlpD